MLLRAPEDWPLCESLASLSCRSLPPLRELPSALLTPSRFPSLNIDNHTACSSLREVLNFKSCSGG